MKRFKRIYIEITNVCNMSCSFCPTLNRTPEFMSISTFHEILRQITPYTSYVYFHVKGEPLLHKDLSVLLDLCEQYDIQVNITTNATLIKEKTPMLIEKKALRQINMSLHSFENMQNDNEFKDYIDNVVWAAKEINENRDVYIGLRLWNLDKMRTQSEGNNYIISSLSNAFNIDIIYELEHNAKNKLTEQSVQIANKVFLSTEEEFVWPNFNNKRLSNVGFCYGLDSMAAILVDGTVVPCCLDADGNIPLGNINTTSFGEIISSERAINIHNSFLGRKVSEELCRHCSYRERFNRKLKPKGCSN